MNTLFTTVIGLVAGIIKRLILTSMEHSKDKHRMTMEIAGLKIQDTSNARQMKGTQVNWARRFIVVSLCMAVAIAPVMYAFIHPDGTVSIPVPSHEGSFISMFIPWIDPIESYKYETVPVMAIAMPLYDSFMLLISFYFGSGGSGGYKS